GQGSGRGGRRPWRIRSGRPCAGDPGRGAESADRPGLRSDPHQRRAPPDRTLRPSRGRRVRGDQPGSHREPALRTAAQHDRPPLHARSALVGDDRDAVKPRPLAVTLGDPAGVGPEIVVKALALTRPDGPAFFVVGDQQSLASASAAGEAVVRRIATPDEALGVFPDALPVLDLPLPAPPVAGRPSPSSADAVIRWIETATELALSGEVGGVVTAPIAKAP